MDTWRPVSTAYGACSNTESASRPNGAVSAVGSDSSAGTVIGKRRWISVIKSWFWAGPEARWRRASRQWAWRYLDCGIDGDLALLLAVRSQHDGIDWDRFAGPAGPGQPTGHHQLADPRQLAEPSHAAAPRHPADPRPPAPRSHYDGVDWDCARDQGERVP
jgi:hypothetical protein